MGTNMSMDYSWLISQVNKMRATVNTHRLANVTNVQERIEIKITVARMDYNELFVACREIRASIR